MVTKKKKPYKSFALGGPVPGSKKFQEHYHPNTPNRPKKKK